MHAPPAIECFKGSGGSAQFVDGGRSFGAYVLAGLDAPDGRVDEARRVLDTLRVSSEAWTVGPEADWVRGVAEAGGYRVVGDSGSALVAEGKGRSFYIWTTRAERPLSVIAAEAGNWRRLAVVGGVPVYGDDDLWRFWEAQGFVFWAQAGPRADSVVPSPAELAQVLAASATISPPPRG